MKIRVLASTKEGYIMPKEEAVLFSGKAAGFCYLPNTVDSLLLEEPKEKTLKRANGNIKLGHHSVFGHATYNLVLEEIPKILAMILNNEKAYNTSEKSARYTVMKSQDEKEMSLYEKWLEIYKKVIREKYPRFSDRDVEKLAQENARYLISVFTPATSMEYTVSFQQLNFIISWSKQYIAETPEDEFSVKVKKVLSDFLAAMPDLEVEGLNCEMKQRRFSLFATRERRQEFGENYSVNYLASFAQLAQAQRHRTLAYEMIVDPVAIFYIPPIIKNTMLVHEWYDDMKSLRKNFPQGKRVYVNERGTIENFVLKCSERLCGSAQLEIRNQTAETLKKYRREVENKPNLAKYLEIYSKGPRCTFPGWKCSKPCIFGPKNALNEII